MNWITRIVVLALASSCATSSKNDRQIAGKSASGEACREILGQIALKTLSANPVNLVEHAKHVVTPLDFQNFIMAAQELAISNRDFEVAIKVTPFYRELKLNQTEINLVKTFGDNRDESKLNQVLKKVQQEMPHILEQNIDARLANLAKTFSLKPLHAPKKDRPELVNLGRSLFGEKKMSGNHDIACQNCHRADLGGADGMPLSVGHGAIDTAAGREQGDGTILMRNSPSVTNLGYDELDHMFWDGRVAFNLKDGIIETPEPGLNGPNPVLKDIRDALKDPLAFQAIFPLLSREEMRGASGNELAQAATNVEVWDRIMKRLFSIEGDSYKEMFRKAFPDVRRDKFNIGHVGTAIAAFLRQEFQVRSTPYDRYLAGDLAALTAKQKKGMEVFLTKGRCANCHFGEHLAGVSTFLAVGVPHIGTAENFVDDLGRGAITGRPEDNYRFRTPPLRNVAKTAPYMHNGAFKTLADVVEHYDNVKKSLDSYQLDDYVQQFYKGKIGVDKDQARNAARFEAISMPVLKQGLNFSQEEEDALIDFLEHALTDDGGVR